MTNDRKQFTDIADDTITLSTFGNTQLYIHAVQDDGDDEREVYLRFNPEESLAIRDHLLRLFPLPTVTVDCEPAMTSVGELASFAPAQGITINIAHLMISNK